MLTPFEQGQLVAQVDVLQSAVEKLSKEVELLNQNLSALDKELNKGKGWAAGVIATCLAFGSFAGWVSSTLFGGRP